VKILTVEDPVEYQMPGINQIQVKPQINLSPSRTRCARSCARIPT
jgi:type II secretory ATPase GspE/PulE/Tfp pilus assembly ATPase PilB-like protein